ncbi:hypothetical protein BC835DRAFT_1304979 [Cytidiella melzeri]|nr:hypothetical protein BC835DRAFT_1304979 [Cytidiella melzeri]
MDPALSRAPSGTLLWHSDLQHLKLQVGLAALFASERIRKGTGKWRGAWYGGLHLERSGVVTVMVHCSAKPSSSLLCQTDLDPNLSHIDLDQCNSLRRGRLGESNCIGPERTAPAATLDKTFFVIAANCKSTATHVARGVHASSGKKSLLQGIRLYPLSSAQEDRDKVDMCGGYLLPQRGSRERGMGRGPIAQLTPPYGRVSPKESGPARIDGQQITLNHGYPFRIVVPRHNGARWVTWVTDLQVPVSYPTEDTQAVC